MQLDWGCRCLRSSAETPLLGKETAAATRRQASEWLPGLQLRQFRRRANLQFVFFVLTGSRASTVTACNVDVVQSNDGALPRARFRAKLPASDRSA